MKENPPVRRGSPAFFLGLLQIRPKKPKWLSRLFRAPLDGCGDLVIVSTSYYVSGFSGSGDSL